MKAKEFRGRLDAALAVAREDVDRFRSLPVEASSSEIIERFDTMLSSLNGPVGWAELFANVHPDGEMRTTCEEFERELSAFQTELSLDRTLFERLQACVPDELESEGERRLLEHALRDFRRSGVDRDEATRQRISSLSAELVAVGQDFDRNIMTGGKEYVVRDGHAGLSGLPADFLESHPEREDGSVLLSTDSTDRIPVLTYAEDGNVRKEYFRVAMNRAVPQNMDVLPLLLSKRNEMAQLLGYAHWADYITEDKMTRSGQVAGKFIERVIELVKGRASDERDELLEELRKDRADASGVGEWDRTYLTERVKRARFGFDSQSVRPYFSFNRVRDGVLATSAALYGVRIERNRGISVWDEAVECYDVLEGQGDDVVARFFLDMHPRANKFKHAAMFHVAEGVMNGDGVTLAQACLVCNFPQPTEDDPALLVHEQVTTFFHEVGHLLHHLFAGRQRWYSFAGISTERDFVEVPSQMYEEWAWDADVLQTFARHYETSEPIPAELVEEMRRAHEYGKGLHVLTQMCYASISLELYNRDPSGLDPLGLMNRLREELLPLELDPENRFLAAFGHLHGYSAMYYTYMWSLVIAKDCFSAFEGNLMNGATANRYRQTVLAPGGSKDASELIHDFLGRAYAFDAFESWLMG